MALPLAFLALCVIIVLGNRNAGLAIAAVVFFAAALWRQWRYSSAIERLGFSPQLANYLLPGAALFSLLLVNSTWAHRWRGRVEWKGREYRAGAPRKEAK
jgi:hypothetical protein